MAPDVPAEKPAPSAPAESPLVAAAPQPETVTAADAVAEIRSTGEKTAPVAPDDAEEVGRIVESDILRGPNGEIYPTAEELLTLRPVRGKIEWIIYTIAIVEMVERFSYYGTTTICKSSPADDMADDIQFNYSHAKCTYQPRQSPTSSSSPGLTALVPEQAMKDSPAPWVWDSRPRPV